MKRKFTINAISNNSPSCVLLDSLKGKHYSKYKFRIFVTLNFNEESSEVFGGYISYGLNRANLILELNSCTMTLSDRNMVANFEKTVQVERQHRSNNTDNTSNSHVTVISAELSSKSQAVAKTTSNYTEGRLDEVTNKFNTLVATISASGDRESPQWHFHNLAGSPYLTGCICEEDLGLITIGETPAIVKASVKVRPRDVSITASEGIWPNENNVNKYAVAKALVWHLLLKDKFMPHVSYAELMCDDNA